MGDAMSRGRVGTPQNRRASRASRWPEWQDRAKRAIDLADGHAASDVRIALVTRLKIGPGRDVALRELAQELPARRLEHLIGQEGVPGDAKPEGVVLRQGQGSRELALHDRERAGHRRAGLLDLVDRVRRRELEPVE